jgi:hypothetical protein
VRHGKTRSPKADFTALLKMRGATQVHHEHARPSDRANVSNVRLPVRQQNLDFREGSGVGRRVCRACSTVPDLPPDGQGFLVIEHCAEIEDVEITTARLASPKMFGLA